MKRPGLVVIGLAALITGLVFFFQGINVLKGSTMTGETQWAVIGGIMVVAGAGVIAAGLRPARSHSDLD